MGSRTHQYISQDLDRFLPHIDVEVAFDVGANVGQTTRTLRKIYPHARLFAFEPVAASFELLVQVANELEGVDALNYALGARSADVQMTARGTSRNNRIVAASKSDSATVTMVSGDDVCREQRVDRINYLKIDTEGAELDVLRGFSHMLGASRIDVVELEAGMNPQNRKHAPFEGLKAHLEDLGYALFGIYEQTSEKRGNPTLRRANVVFISGPTVEHNTIPRDKDRRPVAEPLPFSAARSARSPKTAT